MVHNQLWILRSIPAVLKQMMSLYMMGSLCKARICSFAKKLMKIQIKMVSVN